MLETRQEGLRFTLTPSHEPVPDPEGAGPQGRVIPLDPEQAVELLERVLPEAPAPPVEEFQIRPSTAPLPRSGETHLLPFPPTEAEPPLEAEPTAQAKPPLEAEPPSPAQAQHLEVASRAPEGEVRLPALIQVRFNQPVVALTAIEALTVPPARVTPELKGEWRWTDPQLLVFEPECPVPDGLSVSVEIPAGLRAASGAELRQPVRWSFSTPPVKVEWAYPSGNSVPLDPELTLRFSQPVVPEQVLTGLTLRSAGGSIALCLDDRDSRNQGDRVVKLRPVEPLEPDTEYVLDIRGVLARGGNRPMHTPHRHKFRTYGPLQLERSDFGSLNDWALFQHPEAVAELRFNNELKEAPSVTVEPPLPSMKVGCSRQALVLTAPWRQGTYRVTIPASTRDCFGQQLGSDQTLDWPIHPRSPQLIGPIHQVLVTDPNQPSTLPIYTVNVDRLHVQAVAGSMELWSRWHSWYDPRKPFPLEGPWVVDRTVEVDARPDELVETVLRLEEIGQLVIRVGGAVDGTRIEGFATVWLQRTRIGLTAFLDHQRMVALATDLATGRARPGLRLRGPSGIGAVTDAQGMAELPGTCSLHATDGEDEAFLHADRPAGNEPLAWHVVTDRQLYRPGEQVTFRGWVRRLKAQPDAELHEPGATEVSYKLLDPRHTVVKGGTLPLGRYGSIDYSFTLPPEASLGEGWLVLRVASDRTEHYCSFRVEEFRRPEFEVSVRGPAVHQGSGSLEFEAAARYYSGGGLASAPIDWQVRLRRTGYTPPGRGDFRFGQWRPRFHCYLFEPAGETRQAKTAGRTDDRGRSGVVLSLENFDEAWQVEAEASVTDQNQQRWSACHRLLAHPAEVLVGLRLTSWLAREGEPVEIEVLVCDLEGRCLADIPVRLDMRRWDRDEDGGEIEVTSASTPTRHRLPLAQSGVWRISAKVQDARGRRHRTELPLWSQGAAAVRHGQETLELIPDREEYQPGDTARVLVLSPLYPAEGLLVVGRSGLVRTERFRLDGPSCTVEFPVGPKDVPNLHLEAHALGSGAREEGLPRRPAVAHGRVEVAVPPHDRTLAVRVLPEAATCEPDQTIAVAVQVLRPDGTPAGDAEVTLVVVDEAVLALAGYRLPNPLQTFYQPRESGIDQVELRSRILEPTLEWLRRLAQEEADRNLCCCLAEDASSQESPGKPSPPRVDFRPLAHYSPALPCDDSGRARVSFTLPGSLTRYRITAVAAEGTLSFGLGEAALTTRRPLMVRPSFPRFLQVGDRVDLSVTVQNLEAEPARAKLALWAQNLELEGARGYRLELPGAGRLETRFSARATRAGLARVGLAMESSRQTDSTVVEVPVLTPASTEAFAIYGQLDQGAAGLEVRPPSDVFPQYGGLELQLSSTALQALTDALIYLWDYPYSCCEQLSSRVLGALALKDVLAAFGAAGLPSAGKLKGALQAQIDLLLTYQHHDGGFGTWRGPGQPEPFMSVHAAHALLRASRSGFKVGQGLKLATGFLAKLEPYLRVLDRRLEFKARGDRARPPYSPAVRNSICAYAVWTGRQLDPGQPAFSARRFVATRERSELTLEAWAWLLPGLAAEAPEGLREGLDLVRNQAIESAATAEFHADYHDLGWRVLHSDRRLDALLLDSLIQVQPDSHLLPKLVAGLLGHQLKGRWRNTQENVFVLLALDRYFKRFEAVEPDFTASAWLGASPVLEQHFKGRSTDRFEARVPMDWLARAEVPLPLVVAKQGPGRLYYRAGLRYSPRSLTLPACSRGFRVSREYRGPGVRRDADGWVVPLGSTVEVVLGLQTVARRYHVALVDPLPAGFEPVPPGTDPRQGDSWFEHQNQRDQRTEVFATLLWGGHYTYRYRVRATACGEFVAPPARAEEMYYPETFGRSASDRVAVQ
ncbi:MAG: hypothetical protein HY319_02525 [Armatimonadetes bacterium]|nr:hypothetical protein [Armatimonadota bacterium]